MDTNCAHAQYSANAWQTDTMRKVRQDTGTNPGSACTGTYRGTQNEFVDFQVHWHAPSATTGLQITVSNFVQTAPASSTINCATLTQCVIYREAYMNVTTKTATGVAFYNATGFYPDALIPKIDPYWGQTTVAFPVNVTSGQNQSAWIDVLIPAAAPSGYYLGSVTIQTGCPGSCVTVATMPVTLAVWQWPASQGGKMPSKATLKGESASTNFSYNGLCTQMYAPGSTSDGSGCGAYQDATDNDSGNTRVWLDMELVMLDHRYGSGARQNIFPESGSFATWVSLMGPMLSGTGGTHGGAMLPVLPGAQANEQQLQWLSGSVPSAAVANNWQSNFVSNGWGNFGLPPLMNNIFDEPSGTGSFTTIYNNSNLWHSYHTPAIPQGVTSNIVNVNNNSVAVCGNATCLQNVLDIIVPNVVDLEPVGQPLQNPTLYTSWLAGNNGGIPRQWWSYQSCSSSGTCGNGSPGGSQFNYPNYNIDGKPAANRAMEWESFKHGQTGELYYSVDICTKPSSQGANCGFPSHVFDPWQSVYYSGGWGDGTFLYAMSVGAGNAAKPNYAGSGVATSKPLIVPSIRLKHARDGIQDYEYLNALTVAGQGAFVTTQVNSWVTNTYTFETSGTGLQAARLNIGNALHALSFGGTPWAPYIAANRAMNWANVGVEGGIPSASWTQCGPTITSAAAGSDTTVINAALAHTQAGYTGCTNNQYILLSGTSAAPATFTLSGCIIMQSNGALRGGGPDATFLIMTTPTGSCQLQADVGFQGQVVSGISSQIQPGGTQSALWTGGYAAGSTSITVANVGSTGIQANQIVNLDQSDDPMTIIGGVPQGPAMCTQGGGITLNNTCTYDAASGDARGGSSVATPAGWGFRNGTVTISGNTVTRTTGTWPSDGSWNSGTMILTLYNSANGTGTAQTVTVASVGATPFTSLTLTAPPAGGNGTYSFVAGAGTATLSGTTLTSTAGVPFVNNGTLPGQAIYLMQNNVLYIAKVASVNTGPPITLVLSSAPAPGNGTYEYFPSVHSQIQMVRVLGPLPAGCATSCIGAGPFTLTIDRPLYASNWKATNGPGVWWATTTLEKAGIENLSIDQANHSTGFNGAVGMMFMNACNSWVKNVRSIKGIRNHIVFYGGCRNEVSGSYLVDVKNAQTQSYGIEQYRAGDNLIRNNIFQHLTTPIVPDITQGSVYADNFGIDNFNVYVCGTPTCAVTTTASFTITNTSQSGLVQTYTYDGNLAVAHGATLPISIAGTTNGSGTFNHNNVVYTSIDSTHFSITCGTQATCSSATIGSASETAAGLVSNSTMFPMSQMHGPGDMYNLYESNIGVSFYADADHGPAFFNTFFRNFLWGCEKNKNTGSRIPFRVEPTNGYFNVVGNILGSTSACAVQGSYERNNSNGATSPPVYDWEPFNLNGLVVLNVVSSTRSQNSTMRWGNCDTISSPSCRFVAGEGTVTDSFGFPNSLPSTTTLPASFWTSTAPVYNLTPQGTVPFPAIGPDITATNTAGTPQIAIAPDLAVPANTAPAAHAWNNAAELCYMNSPIDPAYPLEMDRGMLLFNGTNCYANASPVPTVSLTPNPLAFGNQNVNTTSGVQFATLLNTGTVTISSIAVTVTGNFTRSGGTCTATLAVGASCTIGITFSPNATGPFTGTLSITSNAVPSPTVINLTGTGTQATITWSSPQGGTAYNFGNIPVSSSINSANLTLSNTGSGPLNVAVTITGANPAQFSIISTTCSSPLAAGNSCTYVVRFTAAAATTYTASLTETDTLASNSPQSLTMSGSGFIPVVNPVVPWPAIIIQ